VVLITGASSGIGRASAIAFVRRGYRVIAVARSETQLRSLAEDCDAARLPTIVADVTDAASVEAMVGRVLGEHGLPDVVVANAGVGLDALFTRTSDAALRAVFEVNVFGVVRTIRPFIGPMIERGSGRLLLISSIVGKRGTPHYSAYSASKFALHGLADALRAELVGTNVSVGLVDPSSTESRFQDNLLRDGPQQNRSRPRRHTAESVADAIVRMAESRRREVILGFEAKLLHWANVVAPGFVDRLLAKKLRRSE
jgi:short-subunit dehydrogenase